MKVLYFGHYKEGTGWAQAAIDYILALDSVGVDVVCRNINLTGVEHQVPNKILELESKSTEGAEFCIQHLLPHHLVGTESFKKNVAYFAGETTTIKHQPWFVHLQQVDEVWVPNSDLWSSLSSDSLPVGAIKVLPHTKDISTYKQPVDPIEINGVEDKFKFYCIADLNDRKNLVSTIRCFHSEFSKHDNVALVVKVKKHGVSQQDLHNHVIELSETIKRRLRVFSKSEMYADVVVIAENVPGSVISSIHQLCDCYVGISKGEGWSIPAFDAMAFGNTPICGDFGGPKEFIDNNDISTGKLIGGQLSICDCQDAAFPEIFTGLECWFEPSEVETKKAMRYYYENRQEIDRTSGIKRAEKFSYEEVGNQIKEFLNG